MKNFGITFNQVFLRIISLYEHRYPSVWFSVWFAFFSLGEIPWQIRQKKGENQQAVSQHSNIPHKQRSFNSQPHDHNEHSVPLQNTMGLNSIHWAP